MAIKVSKIFDQQRSCLIDFLTDRTKRLSIYFSQYIKSNHFQHSIFGPKLIIYTQQEETNKWTKNRLNQSKIFTLKSGMKKECFIVYVNELVMGLDEKPRRISWDSQKSWFSIGQ
jgi:hypothetical protein